ncbi:MAG: DUF1508 domain-containing protein, partial [Gemmataceae bacterium]|nr:DUF1508 domain-containing protein [Gemmataceae bacterium]
GLVMKKLFSGTAFAFLLALTALSASPATMAQTKGKTDPPKKVEKAEKAKVTAGISVEVYKDSAGEYRFRIKDGDTLLATSGKGYEKKADCQAVIDNLKANFGKAKIEDKSAEKAK